MIRDKKVLALITARGGSKGLPKKNIRMLGDKPLIAWTIDSAKASKYLDAIVVSTDDQVIADVAIRYGAQVPYMRDQELAKDDTPSIDVVLDACERFPSYEIVVLLQPTSPLRTSLDIDECLERLISSDCVSCVSVCEVEESPFWMFKFDQGSKLVPLMPGTNIQRRQDLPAVYILNGAVYAADSKWLAKSRSFIGNETIAYVMPRERSIDIDTEADFQLVSMSIDRNNKI